MAKLRLPLDDPAIILIIRVTSLRVSPEGFEPSTYSLKGSHSTIELWAPGDPTGIRTQVTRLKTSCPSPLDDGAPSQLDALIYVPLSRNFYR